jgi:hypothetical protein
MVDPDWLLSACPNLKTIPCVLVLHGDGKQLYNHIAAEMHMKIIFSHSRQPTRPWPSSELPLPHAKNTYCVWDNA